MDRLRNSPATRGGLCPVRMQCVLMQARVPDLRSQHLLAWSPGQVPGWCRSYRCPVRPPSPAVPLLGSAEEGSTILGDTRLRQFTGKAKLFNGLNNDLQKNKSGAFPTCLGAIKRLFRDCLQVSLLWQNGAVTNYFQHGLEYKLSTYHLSHQQ